MAIAQTCRRSKLVWVGLGTLLLSACSLTPVKQEQRVQGGLGPALEFVSIPAGCFEMGSDRAAPLAPGRKPEGPRTDELPRHRVCVDGFWLGKFEVTRAQWQTVMGGEPVASARAKLPQAGVTWEAAQAFITRLNRDGGDYRYRLPTEAEWEYACRAGSDDRVVALDSDAHLAELKTRAWFAEPVRSDAQARPVGELQPNPWGLHDMLGNVWEWTADEYLPDGYRRHRDANPLIDQGGEKRVIRGGSYVSDRFQVRCGSRSYGLPADPLPTQGLRLVRYRHLSN